MSNYTLYQIDAFASKVFTGNPAAVVSLDEFLRPDQMQAIAMENNLSETAFVVARADGSYDLRWFTPAAEIEFCGHATIASAHMLIAEKNVSAPLTFHAQIGTLVVALCDKGYTLYAPNYPMEVIPVSSEIIEAFGSDIVGAFQARNNTYIEMSSADAVQNYVPDMGKIKAVLKGRAELGLSIMAKGSKDSPYDFVSRHFAPGFGVDEDPVTGSAHSALAPFWAKRLGKAEMLAHQCSRRGGALHLTVTKDEVQITGEAITYMRGTITI